jgi:hypothetical protein
LYQIFKKKYILEEGEPKKGVVYKKMDNGNEYLGHVDQNGKK